MGLSIHDLNLLVLLVTLYLIPHPTLCELPRLYTLYTLSPFACYPRLSTRNQVSRTSPAASQRYVKITRGGDFTWYSPGKGAIPDSCICIIVVTTCVSRGRGIIPNLYFPIVFENTDVVHASSSASPVSLFKQQTPSSLGLRHPPTCGYVRKRYVSAR